MNRRIGFLLVFMAMLSCTKEKLNSAPTTPSNFRVIIGGTSTKYSWSASTDVDGNTITYDVSVLDDVNSTPLVIATNVTTNTFISTLIPLNTPKTMIVTAKDGKGGTTTGVENPTIIM
jgi:hypothetical protein